MQFRSIVSLACAVSLFTGSALASAVYARRVDELTMERDIYASREENWMKGPQIPRSLLHSMYEVHTEGGGYDKEQGGQWKPGTTVETAFQGVVMPLNNEDLQYIDSGSYTLNAQKVYTNGHTLQVGAQFRDGFDGQIYTVKQELTHGPVHSMKRYMVEKKGESNPK